MRCRTSPSRFAAAGAALLACAAPTAALGATGAPGHPSTIGNTSSASASAGRLDEAFASRRGSRGRLGKPAALRQAKRSGRRLAARSFEVDGLTTLSCTRRARRRVDCKLLVRGHTDTQSKTCTLRVVVRAMGRRRAAEVASVRCETATRGTLTYAQAEEAMRVEGGRIATRGVVLFAIERLSRLSFSGVAEWTRLSTLTGAEEHCSVELTVELLEGGALDVATQDHDCQALSGRPAS